MKLFPDWQGIITLPPSPQRKMAIGGNNVLQNAFRGGIAYVDADRLEEQGQYLIKTSLSFPFNEMMLRLKGSRRIESDGNHLVLFSPDVTKIQNLTTESRLTWDDVDLLINKFSKPEQVLENWKDKFRFREQNDDDGVKGLRPPQIGALHAIAAHFAVGEDFEPATVVLPTGTGKTETMLSLHVYKRPSRSLVIVPSDALRTQISNKFITLGVLPEVEVVPAETIGPSVARLNTGIRSVEEAKEIIEKANVIVALPQTLGCSDPEALKVIVENCTDLIVDEAHHIPASQWAKVRQMFDGKRITQFTATPFRRDNKRIDGKIIFNYKLGDAQKADYYRPINLKTIEEFGDEEQRDYRIAEAALAVLRNDRNQLKLDHILMARCDSKDRAIQIFNIYQQLAPEMSPQLIYSGTGRTKENRNALSRLIDRSINPAHIVICVDMLGEGFDLPNLKVAALHDAHKSLAITLQFVGRFTRKGNWRQIGEATVIANIADHETEAKLEALYAEGADWDRLVRRLSEERIDQEIKLQSIVHSLREGGDLHTYLSLWNLRPTLSAQIFKTNCDEWYPEKYASALPKDSITWPSISKEDDFLVAVVQRSTRVRWGNYQSILDRQYHLLMAKWDKANKALFIFASDYDDLKSVSVAKAITDENTILLQGPVIFNILNNVELPLVKNLGSSRVGAISFTSYFGPNVTDGLAQIERAESTLNNIACVGYENGERVLWGGTQKRGKVWQQTAGTIAQWIEWTKRTWEKVTMMDEVNATNITNDFLRPRKLDKPYEQYPISVQWGEQAQATYSDQFIVFGEVEVPLYLTDLQISGVKESGQISISISCDNASAEYIFMIDSQVTSGYRYEKISGPTVYYLRGKSTKIEISEYFIADPVIVRYSDGTYSYNCYHIPVPLNAGEFSRERLEVWDWTSIPLNKESIGKLGIVNTIQYRSYMMLADNYDLVFNDDGKGEAGDLVCLKDVDDSTIKLCLVHCKGAHESRVSNDIRNFYTVCGQAQKSITVKHQGIVRLYYDLKNRNEIWAKEGYSRFLKGDMKQLSYFKEKSRRSKLQFEMIIVQPGGSKESLSSDILKLLGTTELYVKTTTLGEFRVVVSP